MPWLKNPKTNHESGMEMLLAYATCLRAQLQQTVRHTVATVVSSLGNINDYFIIDWMKVKILISFQ